MKEVTDLSVVEIGDSRTFLFAHLLGSAALAIGSLALVSLAPALGVVGSIAFSLHTAWSARRLVAPKVRLRITEEGVLDDVHWYSPGFIPWEEIYNVRKTSYGLIELDLVDDDAFRERLSFFQRMVRLHWGFYGMGPEMVSSWPLASTKNEVFVALESGLEAFTLAAVRQGAALGPPGPRDDDVPADRRDGTDPTATD